ncbi:type II toxin-antitoxin system PemK/MazF family toxin [Kribbella sp. HUAS MG21]|uniref:Type II toxin-antitoxin system PemK/MazF family toxin n=1 Tax=Kribbella sp. HUAS MG21 TaxID=3160966 RepID=A0AAU7TIT5_9ACTN
MALKLQKGEVRRTWVPFNDQPSQAKFRPVVVLGWSKFGPGEDAVVLTVPITSFDGQAKPLNGDIELDWKACGLTKKSWARARRVWGVDPKIIDQHYCPGRITSSEMSLILLEIEAMF